MSIEAMKMALKFMHSVQFSVEEYVTTEAALVAAIEQAEKPQRVCSGCDKTNTDDSMWAVYCVDCWGKTEALEEVKMELRLTDDEIRDLWSWSATPDAEHTATTQQHAFARAIESKLKGKNDTTGN